MGHYRSEMCCQSCGAMRCVCPCPDCGGKIPHTCTCICDYCNKKGKYEEHHCKEMLQQLSERMRKNKC